MRGFADGRGAGRRGAARGRAGARPGFSMVELAIVLLVIGALAAVAVPRMAASAVHSRLQAAGREAASIISAVRDEARASSTTVAVRFEPLGGTVQASVVDPATMTPVAVSGGELMAAGDGSPANDDSLPRLSPATEESRRAAFLSLQQSISRVRRSNVTATYIVTELPHGVQIISANLGGDDVLIFRGHGEPDSGGTVVLGVGSDRLTLTVNAGTGAVTLSR